jgi:uncharacterized protein YjiS (DUF1127 family)
MRSLSLSRLPMPRPLAWGRTVSAMLNLRRQRHDLRALDAHLLRDIGITATDARREADRAPWDVPSHWRSRR